MISSKWCYDRWTILHSFSVWINFGRVPAWISALHLQYPALYKDAVASQNPGRFVAAGKERLSIKGLALDPSYTWYPWAPKSKNDPETVRKNVGTYCNLFL